MSDRLRLIEARVQAQYWISASLAWPRIWMLAAEEVRAAVRSSRAKFTAACMLASWSIGYILIGLCWWPSVLIGLSTFVIAWYRARIAIDEFAVLVESLIDIHVRQLADSLGVRLPSDHLTSATGTVINDILHKGD